MQLSCIAMDNVGKLVPMTGKEVKSRMKHIWLPTPPLWGRMYALANSIPAIAKIGLIGVVPSLKVGGIWMPVHWRHYSQNMRSGWESCLEMRPVYKTFIKITKKDDIWIGMFPHNKLGNQLLKEDSEGRTQIASSLKVPLMLFLYGCPSRTGGSWAGKLICHHDPSFLSSEPTLNQHQQPRPDGSTPDSATFTEKHPITIIMHPPYWFCCICSFTLWATILLVSIPTPITFLNCCSLVVWRQSAWVFHPAKISVLNWRQSLFNWLIFVPFVKIPKLSKFSIITRTQLSGFSRGAISYASLHQKSQIC